MNQSESPIVLLKPRDEVAKKLDDLICRGEIMREKLLKKPLASDDELRSFVVEKDGGFHKWIIKIKQDFNESFSPAGALLERLQNVQHLQWQYHLDWQERAKVLPKDINTHLEFLKHVRGAVINLYEEAPPDMFNDQPLPELRKFMDNHFNKQELSELCFDLGIEYQNLEADSRDGLVIELIEYESRHDELPQLIERVKELRPQKVWDF